MGIRGSMPRRTMRPVGITSSYASMIPLLEGGQAKTQQGSIIRHTLVWEMYQLATLILMEAILKQALFGET